MSAMIERTGEYRLGIEGAPPEMSMYRSLLEDHGLHREGAEGRGFTSPKSRANFSLKPAWVALKKQLDGSEKRRVSLAEIYGKLKQPPYGMKDGVLPVVVLAALIEGQSEIAIYEDGVFAPDVSALS